MLVTMKEILKLADATGTAIGAFNTPNMTSVLAAIDAAEELNKPVIIMHAQLHEQMGLCRIEEIGPVMLHLADLAKVPVCVHLDHGEDIDYIKRGLDIGFNSVMYDGSMYDEAVNTAYTSMVVELAAKTGASVEAEIGSMGERDSGVSGDPSIYTDPYTAQRFARNTGIDALSCAFGTVHGLYLKEPKLDFERLAKIESLLDVPIVMHGGSGVSAEDYKKVIKLGVRKVNYYTYMAKAGGAGVCALADKTYFHDIEKAARTAMCEDIKQAINMFSNVE